MIRVTVELLPLGDESRSKVLGVAKISNDGRGSILNGLHTGDYDVWLSKREPKQGQKWRSGRVEGFPRKRLGAWDLLYRALHATVGERNREVTS